MNQKLVTKKNRKVRRLMTLYPDVRCKVLYQRDYLQLLVKYGLEEPEQGPLVEGIGPSAPGGAVPPATGDDVTPLLGDLAG